MTIVWSERSIERLAAIHDYIAEDSEVRASEILSRLMERVESLRAFPESGRVVPRYEHLDIREVLESSYRILYRRSGDRIEVVNIIHSRQNY